uniref:hypothetical protein n=1 Tax=Burkholderia glumae TaxID=337 RepID=UPI0005BB5569
MVHAVKVFIRDDTHEKGHAADPRLGRTVKPEPIDPAQQQDGENSMMGISLRARPVTDRGPAGAATPAARTRPPRAPRH